MSILKDIISGFLGPEDYSIMWKPRTVLPAEGRVVVSVNTIEASKSGGAVGVQTDKPLTPTPNNNNG
jgi:hypothetical protein